MSRDTLIRMAAADHVEQIAIARTLSASELRAGFQFDVERVPLINPQRGIFKPRNMQYLLSVRTV